MTAPAIAGVFSAAATPLAADLSPDHAAFATHCKALLEEGCDGIALLGTTGEANSFGIEERKSILEKLVEAGVPAGLLLPGTGLTSVTDTVALTRHAVDLGVRGVLMLPPFYYKGVSEEGLFRAYAAVIEGVGRSELRILLYHIPPIAQVPLPHGLIGRLREAFPEIVVGIKDSSGDLDNMVAMARNFPGFSVLAGADPLMLPLLREGGAGCITACSNLVAADLRLVFDHWADPARAEAVAAAQARIEAWRALSNAYPQLPAVKAMLARRRGADGWTRLRPPLVELDEAQRRDLWARMAELEAR